jgi:hypothetical protein
MMAGKRKASAKKAEPTLEMDENGQWWIVVDGKQKQDVGRSRRYAEQMLTRYK